MMPRLCRVRNSKQVSTVITLLTLSAYLVKFPAHLLMSSAEHDKSARLRVKVLQSPMDEDVLILGIEK